MRFRIRPRPERPPEKREKPANEQPYGPSYRIASNFGNHAQTAGLLRRARVERLSVGPARHRSDDRAVVVADPTQDRAVANAFTNCVMRTPGSPNEPSVVTSVAADEPRQALRALFPGQG